LRGLLLVALAIYGYHRMTTPGWQTISTAFMKNDKPYGGGNCRINGNDVMSLKVAGPELRFRAVDLEKGYNAAQAIPEEPWMNDSHERLNRSTVSFLRGTIDGGLTRYFQQPGQDAAWWFTKDWSTQYVSTDWMDFKITEPDNGLTPHITKLWRSHDGGRNWTQLDWPANRNIGQLLFLDAQRGYAVGWGPHVWRTADGGRTWRSIEVPLLAMDEDKPRKTFDAVDLGADGVLRVAYYLPEIEGDPAESIIDRLKWDSDMFEHDVTLPDQIVVSLQSEPVPPNYGYGIYALSRLGPPSDFIKNPSETGHRTGAISTWGHRGNPPEVIQLHTFDARLTPDGLSVGKRGVLLVYATDATGDGAPRDITLASKDYGKSWSETDDGITQGVYFDASTNTQYGLYAYTLKRRTW
jgi:hypothetical protein